MNRITNTGYKWSSWSFLPSFLAMIFVIGLTISSYDFDFRPRAHFVCNQYECVNPIYFIRHPEFCDKYEVYCEGIASADSIICEGDWCDHRIVNQGVYGEKTPWIVQHFLLFVVFLYSLGILFNHLLYNRGKKFDLGLEEYWASEIAKWKRRLRIR